MSSSRLARALASGVALSFLTAPVAFAEGPTTTKTTTTTTTTEATTKDPRAETRRTLALRSRAAHSRAAARRWRALMRDPMPIVRRPTIEFRSLHQKRRWWARRWARKAYWARWHGHRPPHLRAWLCIHRYEGSWHDPYAPYYGGLQMDLTFQRRYGLRLLRRKGTADHWTRYEQMWVAERAHRSGRGFYPWPNTARYCGLI
jgi:hypothetical protein